MANARALLIFGPTDTGFTIGGLTFNFIKTIDDGTVVAATDSTLVELGLGYYTLMNPNITEDTLFSVYPTGQATKVREGIFSLYTEARLADVAHGGAVASIVLGGAPISAQLGDVSHGGPNASMQLGGVVVETNLDAKVSDAVAQAQGAYSALAEKGIIPETWDGSQTTPVTITFTGTGTGEVCFCEWTPANGSNKSLFYYDFGTAGITLDGTFDNGPWTAAGILAMDVSNAPAITAPGTLTLAVKDANGLTRTYTWAIGTVAAGNWQTLLLLKDGTTAFVDTATPFKVLGSMTQAINPDTSSVY